MLGGLCCSLISMAQSAVSMPSDYCGTRFCLDTLDVSHIYFRHDVSGIDPDYKDNRASIFSIKSALNQAVNVSPESIAEIIIEGASSPIC